ncbi:MAG TPA: hypothetical protein VMM36_02680 [Opitutaceae bacterium]|nr:hypothetical protein [Opitutaceae bacterium]
MKTQLRVISVVAAIAAASLCQAQDRIVGKMFIVDVAGDAHLVDAGKVVTFEAGDTLQCKNIVLESGPESNMTAVLSNNTGFYLGPNSRIELTRFEQAPFAADPSRIEDEPSISNIEGVIYSGTFAFCMANQVFGSTSKYSVLGADVSVRGKRIVTEATDTKTIFYVVEGEVTVKAGPDDQAGTVVQSNQQVSITPGVGGAFPVIAVSEIDPSAGDKLNNALSAACLARRAVFFASPEDPRRVLPPPDGPNPPTVSIDRLGN